MPERWMLDQARDRLIVTQAMLLKLQDKLRFGRLSPEQAEVPTAVILAQIEQALELIEEARHGLRKRLEGTAAPAAVAEAPALPEAAAEAAAR